MCIWGMRLIMCIWGMRLTGIQHTRRSQDLNNERLWGGRLCADHIPGGVMIKIGQR
jgi:hypothetical protein